MQWDVGFWAERLREQKYAITDEELRPYFSLPNVLDGLFGVSIPMSGAELTHLSACARCLSCTLPS